MVELLIGSLTLSLIHAAIPNHWLPMIALGRSERWSRAETLGVTALAGSAHTASTICIGIIVGLVGYKLSATIEHTTHLIAPLILVALGLFYLLLGMRGGKHHHHAPEITAVKRKSKWTIIASLSLAMFFSPCLEIEAYFFTAGTHGSLGILLVSSVYLLVTVACMLVLVDLGRRGIEKIEWHFLEHHERAISGGVLIVLGIVSWFVHV